MKSNNHITGLGDAVALVAQPIAAAIDKVAGTQVRHCSACARRRAALNRRFPRKTLRND